MMDAELSICFSWSADSLFHPKYLLKKLAGKRENEFFLGILFSFWSTGKIRLPCFFSV